MLGSVRYTITPHLVKGHVPELEMELDPDPDPELESLDIEGETEGSEEGADVKGVANRLDKKVSRGNGVGSSTGGVLTVGRVMETAGSNVSK